MNSNLVAYPVAADWLPLLVQLNGALALIFHPCAASFVHIIFALQPSNTHCSFVMSRILSVGEYLSLGLTGCASHNVRLPSEASIPCSTASNAQRPPPP
jgi:hypothetical protein